MTIWALSKALPSMFRSHYFHAWLWIIHKPILSADTQTRRRSLQLLLCAYTFSTTTQNKLETFRLWSSKPQQNISYTYTYTYTHTYTHIYTHIHTHIHTHNTVMVQAFPAWCIPRNGKLTWLDGNCDLTHNMSLLVDNKQLKTTKQTHVRCRSCHQ